MAASRAPADPTVTDFDATVGSVDGRTVVLEETYFYPQGGGQPADRGTIEGIQVEHVETVDGRPVHTLAREPAFESGDTVVASIDDAFRRYTMRSHTASHVLYGAGRRLLDDLGYGGFGITDEKVRVDFETTTDVTDEVLVELERLANRAVWESKPVSWEQMDKTEALDRDDVAFNAATEEGVMADEDTIRIVTIDDWDVAACGGTHVGNTKEIGQIAILERSNPGEGLTRVEFAVGPTAHERLAVEHEAVRDASRALGTTVEAVPDEVERILAERADLEDDVRSLTASLAAIRVRDLRTIEKDGQRWRLGVIEDLDGDVVGETMQELTGDEGEAIVVASGEERASVQVATDGAVDASDVVDDLTDVFGGGGGGSPTFAQGGGLAASADDVIAELR